LDQRRSNDGQLREMLRGVPYLAELDTAVIDDIYQLLTIRRFDEGAQLFMRGEGRGQVPFYLILEGTVRVYVTSMRGREQVIRHFHAGDTFAEVPLFDGGSYPVNANAFTDLKLAILPRHHLLELMRRYPTLALGVVKVMSERLRHFTALVEDLSLRRVIGRVAHLLMTEHDANLTQAEMAAMVGTSREMVNRSLHTLEDDGVITIQHHGGIVIHNPKRLNEIMQES
jgi:CRP-like cAMP-binding protein